MQIEAPEAFDLSSESDATLRMYGLERGQTDGFGWQCLVARRLAERGVRFVELIDGGSMAGAANWDSHGDMQHHVPRAANVDRPIAGLVTDLKQRGMLEDTLVVWTTEFGRTPYHENRNAKGREHHHQVFSSWLAGGGVKPGTSFGASDEYGIGVGENGVHVHDFHATILHLLGLNHGKAHLPARRSRLPPHRRPRPRGRRDSCVTWSPLVDRPRYFRFHNHARRGDARTRTSSRSDIRLRTMARTGSRLL